MEPITTTDDLARFCAALAAEPFVAVDTEFMRDRTFWPKLCLVQLAGADRAAAVDPLAPGIDLAPLSALMNDENVLKVFHAARQDLEIFWRLSGKVPAPVFDTQIAAMVAGFGEDVAYDTLVAQLAGAKLDKTSRFTDWSRRPLSPQQLRYALGDVTHLRVIYRELDRRLEETGRRSWVEEELAGLLAPGLYEQPPEHAWKRLKLRSREPRFVAVVQALAAWREREAQRRDLPRNRVLRDDVLLEIAANRPRDPEALANLPRVGLDRDSLRGVVDAVGGALALPDSALPRLEAPPRPPRGIGPIIELLRVLLKQKCESHGVAQRLVANSAELEAIASGERADVPALKGWRRDMFGADALALKRGEIALAVRGKQIEILELEAGLPPAPARRSA